MSKFIVMNEKMKNAEFRLQKLMSADWLLLKQMRLEALLNEKMVFGGSYEEESLRSDDDWKIRLSGGDKAYFSIFDRNQNCIGLTGIFKHKDIEGAAILVASYIRAQYRGLGLSSLLYQARIEWAKENGFKKIIVSHREGNLASKSANQRAGFHYTHSEEKVWPDGQSAQNLFYELNL